MDADLRRAQSGAAVFRPVSNGRPTLPYRQRPLGNPNYLRFSSLGSGSVEVFIELRTLAQIREVARAAWPNEAIGLLAGRACHDRVRTFTVVETVEAARPEESEATAGTVHLSAAGSAAVQRRLAHRAPALDPVGWFHSHPHSSAFFSGEDRLEQATWTEPHNVGIVAGRARGGGGSTLAVYAGPQALLLTRTPDSSIPPPDPVTVATTSADQAADRLGPIQPPPLPSRTLRRLAVAAALLAIAALVLWQRGSREPTRPADRSPPPPGADAADGPPLAPLSSPGAGARRTPERVVPAPGGREAGVIDRWSG